MRAPGRLCRCVPFNPLERMKQSESEPAGETTRRMLASAKDVQLNIGLRLIFGLIPSVHYDNVLGLNVLLIRI